MPLLYELVDALYNGVMQFMPPFLRERPMFSAPALGASGAYAAVRGLQWASARFMDDIIKGFDEKWLPLLEKACLISVPAAYLIYSLADPGAMNAVGNHPVYSAGMAAAYAGAAAGALQDIHRRAVEAAESSMPRFPEDKAAILAVKLKSLRR